MTACAHWAHNHNIDGPYNDNIVTPHDKEEIIKMAKQCNVVSVFKRFQHVLPDSDIDETIVLPVPVSGAFYVKQSLVQIVRCLLRSKTFDLGPMWLNCCEVNGNTHVHGYMN